MANSAQTLANRDNAQHSTGPRTEEGKAHSAANSTQHGLTSREVVIKEGEQEEFDQLLESLATELCPAGELQKLVFGNLIHAAWNQRRCRRAEAELAAVADPFLDDEAARKQQRIQRYAGQAERSYYRALKELKALQTHRALQVAYGIWIPDIDEDGVEEAIHFGILADVPTLLKNGWQSEQHLAGVVEFRRIRREELLADRQNSSQQNEPNFEQAA